MTRIMSVYQPQCSDVRGNTAKCSQKKKRKELQEANGVLCEIRTIKVRENNRVTIMTLLIRVTAPLTFSSKSIRS